VKIFLKQNRTFWTSQLFFHFSSMRGTIKSLDKRKSKIFIFDSCVSNIQPDASDESRLWWGENGGTACRLVMADGSYSKHPVETQRWVSCLDSSFTVKLWRWSVNWYFNKYKNTTNSEDWPARYAAKCAFSW